jgi:hypothetical protein
LFSSKWEAPQGAKSGQPFAAISNNLNQTIQFVDPPGRKTTRFSRVRASQHKTTLGTAFASRLDLVVIPTYFKLLGRRLIT